MTVNATADQEFDQLIATLQQRLLRLELRSTNPDFYSEAEIAGGGNEFDELYLPDEDGDGYVNVWEPPPAPTGLNLATGAFYDRTYIDVDWDPMLNAGGGYHVHVMRKTGPGTYDLPHVVNTYGSSVRVEPLDPNTTYGVKVAAVTALGREGAFTAVSEITTGQDSTLPPAPVGVTVARGATTVLVKYTPLTKAQAEDVANGQGMYEVEIDTVNTFDSVNYRMQRGTDQIIAFNDIITSANWYARVRAIDSSGNSGTWSAVAGPTEAGGVNDSMMVADLNAAKITAGFLSASRIDAASITVDKLAAGTFTAGVIRLSGSGIIVGGGATGPGFTGFGIDATGIRLYSGGVQTVTLDAATGNATFKGTVDGSTITGSTIWAGSYIQMNSAGGLQFTSHPTTFDTTRGMRWRQPGFTGTDLARFYCVGDIANGVTYNIELPVNGSLLWIHASIVEFISLGGSAPMGYNAMATSMIGSYIGVWDWNTDIWGGTHFHGNGATSNFLYSYDFFGATTTNPEVRYSTTSQRFYYFSSSEIFKTDFKPIEEVIDTSIIFDLPYISYLPRDEAEVAAEQIRRGHRSGPPPGPRHKSPIKKPQRPHPPERRDRTWGIVVERADEFLRERGIDPHYFISYLNEDDPDKETAPTAFQYTQLIVPLVLEAKKLRSRVDELERKIKK